VIDETYHKERKAVDSFTNVLRRYASMGYDANGTYVGEDNICLECYTEIGERHECDQVVIRLLSDDYNLSDWRAYGARQ
jgi:hypothetical protein